MLLYMGNESAELSTVQLPESNQASVSPFPLTIQNQSLHDPLHRNKWWLIGNSINNLP